MHEGARVRIKRNAIITLGAQEWYNKDLMGIYTVTGIIRDYKTDKIISVMLSRIGIEIGEVSIREVVPVKTIGRVYVDTAEAAAICGVPIYVVLRWIRFGELPAEKLNGKYRIPKNCLNALKNMQTKHKTMLTCKQAAKQLGTNLWDVRRMIRTNKLQAIKVGKEYLINPEGLEQCRKPAGLTCEQFAEHIGVKKYLVMEWIRQGKLPVTKVGKEYRIDPQDYQPEEINPAIITTAEAAKRCGVLEITIRRWIASGKLPATKIGKAYAIKTADLNLKENSNESKNQ